jgi:hypothetical protein
MVERLVHAAACHAGGRVRFPVPARPTFRVEKVALFCNPASGGTFSSTAIEIIKCVKKIAVAQAKVPHILRPWTTVFKEQLKQLLMVSKDSIEGYMRERKKKKTSYNRIFL